jgi:hypothetical protein
MAAAIEAAVSRVEPAVPADVAAGAVVSICAG